MDNLHLKINLSFQQLVEIVKQLTPTEKLKLNEIIWDNNMNIPIEHQNLVLDRIQKSEADTSRMLDWEEASKTLTFE